MVLSEIENSIKNYLEENKIQYRLQKNGTFIFTKGDRKFFINTQKKVLEKMFNFGHVFIDRDAFKQLFDTMYEDMSEVFENVNKIYFLEDGRDFSIMKTKNKFLSDFVKQTQGCYIRQTGDIYINLPVIRKFTRDMLVEKGMPFTKDTFLRMYNFYVIDTLIHEATHAQRENILYDYTEEEQSEFAVINASLEKSLILKRKFEKFPIIFR